MEVVKETVAARERVLCVSTAVSITLLSVSHINRRQGSIVIRVQTALELGETELPAYGIVIGENTG
jgi:hypothetical protein